MKAYRLHGAIANPFGIVTTPTSIHNESLHPVFNRYGLATKVRLVASALLKHKIRLEGDAISFCSVIYDNYYHFTIECLQRLFILRKHLEKNYAVAIMPEILGHYHRDWIELLGLQEKIFLIALQGIAKPERVVTCGYPSAGEVHNAGVLTDFRSWVLERAKLSETESEGLKLFIGRRPDRRHSLINQSDVYDLLGSYGWVCTDFEGMSLAEQAILMRRASHVLAVHGAALSNLIFCNPGVEVVELANMTWENKVFENMASALGLSYRRVGCEPFYRPGGQKRANFADLFVDIVRLRRLVNLYG